MTDCKSAIQGLQSPKDRLERETRHLLSNLSQQRKVAVQWLPAHCGLGGNEMADSLAKAGSRLEQVGKAMSLKETKTLIKRKFSKAFRGKHDHPPNDQLPHLLRYQQTTIFRLRTGHCRLRSHLHRLGLSHTPDCPYETSIHTPEHILQSCPLHREARIRHWPDGVALSQQLWGSRGDLVQTAAFIAETGLDI